MFWWILESLIPVVVFHEGDFFQQLFFPDFHEFWMRTLTFAIIIIFGIYTQKIINRLRHAKQESKQAYGELDQIFHTAADGMQVVDKDFNILRANDTFLKMAGIHRDEVANKKCYEMFPITLCHTPECPLTRILAGEEYVTEEVEKERRGSSRVSCIITATPFRHPDGKQV